MTPDRLARQIAAAVAVGDRAAELILRARVGCAMLGCKRRPVAGWTLCPTCRERVLFGRAAA